MALGTACGLGTGGELPVQAGFDASADSAAYVRDESGASETSAADGDSADIDSHDGTMHDGSDDDASDALSNGPDSPADSAREAGMPGTDSGPLADAATDAPLDASSSADARTDAGSLEAGTTCDFNGVWGSEITINVSWMPQGITGVILASGSGTIKQWVLGQRVQNGSTVADTTSLCGIALPDFQGTSVAGGEVYGVRFPDSLFDSGYLPSFTVDGTMSGSTIGSAYTSKPNAVLLGLTLANPTTDSWPTTITTDYDEDQDGNPGVTANVAQGGAYTNVPLDLFKQQRADRLYLVIRQITQIAATANDCDHFSGTVSIPQIPNDATGKYAIDSHVIGCGWAGSTTNCTSSQANFVDATQPVFTPSGFTKITQVRLAGNATCATVRQTLQ
jgi:hypothetical protein